VPEKPHPLAPACRLLLFLLALLCLWPAETSAQESGKPGPKKAALLPFAVHSRSDAAGLQTAIGEALKDELRKSSRYLELIPGSAFAPEIEGKPLDDALALRVGQTAGADVVLRGSLTEFGESVSVDVSLLFVRSGKSVSGISAQGKGREDIPRMAAQLAAEILIRTSAAARLAKIDIQGNRRIESDAIRQVVKSTAGQLLFDETLSRDLKAIYRMGYFEDVQASVADGPEGKVLTFTVRERPMITEVRIKGNKAIDTGDIEAVLGVKTRQIVNRERVKEDVEKIRALYVGKGYYNVEIADAVEREGDKEVRVVFTITENKRLFIKAIRFEGNQAFTEKQLRNMMATDEWGLLHFFTDSGVLKTDVLKQDIGKLNAFYLNNGYINAQIGEPEVTHDAKGIYVKIRVIEGKPFKVGNVEIQGDPLQTSRETLRENLAILGKTYYNREAIVRDIDTLTRVCNDEGYAYADVTPRTKAQEKTQTVDIVYEIAKGKQVYFNRISIVGNTRTRDKVLRRQLNIVEGDLYNSSKMKQSYMALNRLRYFEEVDFQSEKGPDDTLTNVTIRVKEKPTGMFSIGAGYSAQEAAMVMGQISQQNLFGRGQILSLKANIGSETAMYELSFTEPWLFDIPLWSQFSLWNFTREYDTYDLDSTGVGATLGYPLWERITGYLGYRLSIDDVYNIDETDASYYVQEQAGKATTSSASLTLSRDTTDDTLFPSSGTRVSASINYAGGPLGGDHDFTKYGATAAWFYPLPLDMVFNIRGRIGYLQRNGDTQLPIYERYVLGGISTLRGLRDVGPMDERTGDIIGGTTMLCGSVEIIFPLIRNAGMKGVVFYDTGNTWESGYSLSDLRQTAGVGIRWYSPIGPLRLEWGYVLDKKDDEDASRFEFTIGMFM
jgi:outer membrane protein insertion porin family